MNKEEIKKLIDLIPKEDLETVYKVILKFVPELEQEKEEIKTETEIAAKEPAVEPEIISEKPAMEPEVEQKTAEEPVLDFYAARTAFVPVSTNEPKPEAIPEAEEKPVAEKVLREEPVQDYYETRTAYAPLNAKIASPAEPRVNVIVAQPEIQEERAVETVLKEEPVLDFYEARNAYVPINAKISSSAATEVKEEPVPEVKEEPVLDFYEARTAYVPINEKTPEPEVKEEQTIPNPTIPPVPPIVPAPAVTPIAPAEPVRPDVPAENIGSDEWKCNVCGRINRNYIGTCACGKQMSENARNIGATAFEHTAPAQAEPVAAPVTPAVQAAPKKTVAADDTSEPGKDEWKCSVCGRINRNYIGTCACGKQMSENARNIGATAFDQTAPAQAEPVAAPVTPAVQAAPKKTVAADDISEPGKDEWKCSVCGRINRNYVGTCACGKQMSENDRHIGVAEPSYEAPNAASYAAPAMESYAAPAVESYEAPDASGYAASQGNYGISPKANENVAKWTCSLCGRVNDINKNTCVCGYIASPKEIEDSVKNMSAGAGTLRDNTSTTASAWDLVEENSNDVMEEKPKNIYDFNSPDYDIAAARAAEEAALAAAQRDGAANMAMTSRNSSETYTQISKTEWRCNLCNRINRNYVGTCACGNKKR